MTLPHADTVVDVLGFAGNALAVVGLLYFVLRYSRVHFERHVLGQAMMGGAVATLALAGVALVYRSCVLLGWPFVEVMALKLLIAVAWAGVGLAFVRHGSVLRRVQAEAAERRPDEEVVP